MSPTDEPYKALFSYGHMRATHLGQHLSESEQLVIDQFVRPEYLTALRDVLNHDHTIFSCHPNTLQQRYLSPLSRQCLWELHSGIMIRLLENITGLSNLLADTHCEYSGLAQTLASTASTHELPQPPVALPPTLTVSIDLASGSATLSRAGSAYLLPAVSPNGTLHACYWQHSITTER